jgi:prepilin-type processing-associated H-X9-DG protein
MFDPSEVQLRNAVREYACESDPRLPREIWSYEARNTPINDWSYVYLGYFLENEAQGMAFARAYPYRAGTEGAFQDDLSVGEKKGNCGTFKLFRLCTEERLPPEAACLKGKAATIPLIIEWPENHRKGAHVVYLDGHTEYVHYPGKFPMTPDFIGALRVIDAEIHLSP